MTGCLFTYTMKTIIFLLICLLTGYYIRAQTSQPESDKKWQFGVDLGYSFRYAYKIANFDYFYLDRSPPTQFNYAGWALAPSLNLYHRPSNVGLRYAPALRYDLRNSIVTPVPQQVPGIHIWAVTDFEWRWFHDHDFSLFTKIWRAKNPEQPWQLGVGLSHFNVNAGYPQTRNEILQTGTLQLVETYVSLAANGYHVWASLPVNRLLGFPTPGLHLEPKVQYFPNNFFATGQVMVQCRALYPFPTRRKDGSRDQMSIAAGEGWALVGQVGLTGRRVQLSGEILLKYPNHLVESHTLIGSGHGLDFGLQLQQRRWGLGLQYSATIRTEPSRVFLATRSTVQDSVSYRITPQRDRPTVVLDHELTLVKNVGRQGIRLGLGHAWLNAGQVVQVHNISSPTDLRITDWDLPVGMRAWQVLAQLPLRRLVTLPTPGLHLEPKFYYVYHNFPSRNRSMVPVALGLKIFYQFQLFNPQTKKQ
jgi:hypothetical protein